MMGVCSPTNQISTTMLLIPKNIDDKKLPLLVVYLYMYEYLQMQNVLFEQLQWKKMILSWIAWNNLNTIDKDLVGN